MPIDETHADGVTLRDPVGYLRERGYVVLGGPHAHVLTACRECGAGGKTFTMADILRCLGLHSEYAPILSRAVRMLCGEGLIERTRCARHTGCMWRYRMLTD